MDCFERISNERVSRKYDGKYIFQEYLTCHHYVILDAVYTKLSITLCRRCFYCTSTCSAFFSLLRTSCFFVPNFTTYLSLDVYVMYDDQVNNSTYLNDFFC